MDYSGGYLPTPKGFATKAIHAGQEPEQWDSRCIIPPIVMSSTFKQYSPASYVCISFAIIIFTEN